MSLTYRADIDGLRAVAVILVLLFHFSLLSGITAGFLGVDIFFVISGFLITSILKGQLDTGTFRLGAFYVNRIRRLAPALFVVLLIVMSAGYLWLFPPQLLDLSKQVLASQFYVANIYYWQSINYFGLTAHDVFLLHTWSLAVEEQFYLIYPACLWLVHRYLKKYFWAALILGLLVSFVLNIVFVDLKPEATFYLLPTRAWQLLIGALVPPVAAAWRRNKSSDELIALLGIGLIAVSVTCYRSNYPIPGFYALLPTLGSACLLLSGHSRVTTISRALSWRPIVYTGKISYSLYLVHWPVNVFAALLIQVYSLHWRVAMFTLSIALAALVYHLVENPLRHRRVLATNRRMLLGYAAGLTVTLSIFLVVQIADGLPRRYPDEVARLASYVNDRTAPLTECEFQGKTAVRFNSACMLGALNKSPTWLVYGDSHAWAAHDVFDKWLKLNDQGGMLIYRHGCPPVTGIHLIEAKDDCFKFNQAVSRFIETQPNLSNIVLVSTWRWPVEGGLLNSSKKLLTPPESMQVFTARFIQTLQHLHSLGRLVYVWEPVPGASRSVPLELARAALQHRPADVDVSTAEYLLVNRPFFDALNKSRRWIAGSFSPSQTLCAGGECAVEVDGTPLYFDNGHMTKSSVDVWMLVLQHRPLHDRSD